MYATIVESKIRHLYGSLNGGEWRPLVDGFAPRFRYRFLGDNALSGVRTTTTSMESWWQRFFRLLPGARFEIKDVLVRGAPWNTRISVWVEIAATLANGEHYRNEYLQLIGLTWGKVASVLTIEDTGRLTAALDRLAQAGVAEAAASPITDEPS